LTIILLSQTRLGINPESASRLFRAVDVNRAGSIDFITFAMAAVCIDPRSPHQDSIGEERLRLIFGVYDANNDGYIDTEEVN
jgi:Ca2+-binding EF-hand superfamily protein